MKKIGFDIHGVIDENPVLFSKIIQDFRKSGYEIHILTGSKVDNKLKNELKKYNITYDFIFSILDHHKKKGTDMWENEDGFWIDDDIWNKTKSIYCEKNKINFHIDDSPIYGKYFTTPFAYLTPTSPRKGRVLEIKGDPHDEILSILKSHEGYYKMKFV